MSIRWDNLGHKEYEDIVSVLVSRLHPDSQRIDGKGGDGGRDVQIVDRQVGTMLEAFEFKSFAPRMNPSRRQQVVRSLERAATLKPRQWTLIVPIDPTPKEDEWFRRLEDNYPFPIRWFGKTWLDEKMAAFPDIRRYFLEGANDEVVRLLRELHQERAKVSVIHDAICRLRTLHERLNEIDPYYRYELSTGPSAADFRPPDVALSVSYGDMRVDVYPKYLGATNDRPITINFTLLSEPIDETFQHAIDYGLGVTIPSHLLESVTIDAPAGLGGSFPGGEIDLLPTSKDLDDPVSLSLNVMDGDRLVAHYPIQLTEQTRRLKGSIITGMDKIEWLNIRLRVAVLEKWFESNFRLTPRPVMPAALIPLLRWITALHPPHSLVIRWPNGFTMSNEVKESFCLDSRFVTVVESLAYLQEQVAIHWEIQPSSMIEEAQVIVTTATLLKGEKVDFTWKSFNLDLNHWGPKLDELVEGGQHSFLVEQDMEFELESVRIPIGRVRTHFESACIADPATFRRAVNSGSIQKLKLVPGNSNKASQRVVSRSRKGSCQQGFADLQ